MNNNVNLVKRHAVHIIVPVVLGIIGFSTAFTVVAHAKLRVEILTTILSLILGVVISTAIEMLRGNDDVVSLLKDMQNHEACVNISDTRHHRYKSLFAIARDDPDRIFWVQRTSSILLGAHQGDVFEKRLLEYVIKRAKDQKLQIIHYVSLQGLKNEIGSLNGDLRQSYPDLNDIYERIELLDGKVIIRGTRRWPQYISKLDPPLENQRFFFANFPDNIVKGVLPLDLVEHLSVVISGRDKNLMDKLWQESGVSAITLDDLRASGFPLP